MRGNTNFDDAKKWSLTVQIFLNLTSFGFLVYVPVKNVFIACQINLKITLKSIARTNHLNSSKAKKSNEVKLKGTISNRLEQLNSILLHHQNLRFPALLCQILNINLQCQVQLDPVFLYFSDLCTIFLAVMV